MTKHYYDEHGASMLRQPYTWDEVVEVVEVENALTHLGRSVQQMAEYRAYRRQLAAQGLDFFTNLLKNFLHWTEAEVDQVRRENPRIFSRADDVAIVENHFPYYFVPGIAHVCVWCKFSIPLEDDDLGDLPMVTRVEIEAFVMRCFVNNKAVAIPRQNIVWFRNWALLQSIPRLAHVHLLFHNVSPGVLSALINQQEVWKQCI